MSESKPRPEAGTDATQDPDDALEVAAEWRVRLADESASTADERAFEQWLRQDPAHRRAWDEIEATWRRFEPARGADTARAVGRTLGEEQRLIRRWLKSGGVLLLLGVLIPWLLQTSGLARPMLWLADHHTGIGQRATQVLDDGTRLVLDTASAVDIDFDDHHRVIRLRAGRVGVDAAPDADRPLVVVTDHARVRVLGTSFDVDHLFDETRIAVLESRVEVCPAGDQADGDCRDVRAGQATATDGREVRVPEPVDLMARSAWRDGQLVVDDRPLAEVLDRLAEYRRGQLRYDPDELAGIRVSGVFPLEDTDRALAAIEATLPVRIEYHMPLLVRVEASKK